MITDESSTTLRGSENRLQKRGVITFYQKKKREQRSETNQIGINKVYWYALKTSLKKETLSKDKSEGMYFYRIANQNDKWNSIPLNNPSINLTALQYGSHTIEIFASTKNGVESDVHQFKININPPLWLNWKFYLLLVSILLVLSFTIYKVRIYILKRDAKIQNELKSSKLSAIKAQMNPHFIFNALNSIQEFIITNEKNLAIEYLAQFADLVRLYLDQSQEDYITLEEEINALRIYLQLEEVRFENTLTTHIEIDKSIDLFEISIPSMFLQTYIENALKHGLLHKKENRQLSINFNNKKEKVLECIIKDNGVGRKKSAEINKGRNKLHKSFSSKANENRLELLNVGRIDKITLQIEDLEDNNKNALGTRVIINIPY